jgi:hypothetical protein
MAWKEDIDNAAYNAAEKYYDEVLVGLGMFPSELRRLPLDREDAIVELARNVVGEVENKFPESSYDEGQANILNNSKASDNMKWLFGYGVDPVVAKEQKDFNTMRGLINPDPAKNEKKWTDMSKQELEHVMQQFGFDSRVKGDYNKFIDLVAQHQLNFDRAKAIQDEMSTKTGMIASLFAPSTAQEVVRQSLTGEYDDDRLYKTGIVDALVGGALFGATRAPGFAAPVLGAGLEGTRQIVNGLMGNQVDPVDITLSAAGAIGPKSGRMITIPLSRSKDSNLLSFKRGFARGLHGFYDSKEAERRGLENLLKSGWRQDVLRRGEAKDKLSALGFRSAEDEAKINNVINAASEQVNTARGNLNAVRNPNGETPRDALLRSLDEKYSKKAYAEAEPAVQRELTGSDLISGSPELANITGEAGLSIDDLAKQLSGLAGRPEPRLKRGYREVLDSFGNKRVVKKSDLKKVSETPDRMPNPYPNVTQKEAVTLANQDLRAAENAMTKANAKKEQYALNSEYFGIPLEERPYIEQVIEDPTGSLPKGTAPISVDDVIKNYYNRPVKAENYRNPVYERNTQQMFSTFPEKYSADIGRTENSKSYKLGVGAGKFFGGVVAPAEAITHTKFQGLGSILFGKSNDKNIETTGKDFRNSEWYKKLDEQKKAAIERALQGAR